MNRRMRRRRHRLRRRDIVTGAESYSLEPAARSALAAKALAA
jgi:hypothetical protein